MFASFRRAFGAVKVKETDKEIFVEGIPADVMQRDFHKLFRTSRIANHMFNTFGKNSFSFYKFFALDIVFILDTLLNTNKNTSKRVIKNIRDELYEHTWLKNTLPNPDAPVILDRSQFQKFKKTPLIHQIEYFDEYEKSVGSYGLNGHLAALAPGSGKTITSLMVAEARHSDYIIVIYPKNAADDPWRKTIESEYKKPEPYWMVADGKPYKGERFLLVHYEAMGKLLTQLKTTPLNSNKVSVILDESHNLNDVKSLRTQTYLDIVEATKAFNVFPMSGTPVKAMGVELIPLLKAVDPMFTPVVEERFKKIFGKDGNRGLAILRNRLGIISYTIEKKDLGLDKPIMHSMPVKMPTGNKFTLAAIRKDMQAFIQERYEYYKKRKTQDEALWAECMAIHEDMLKNKVQKQEYAKYRETVKLVQRNPDTRFMGAEIAYTNVYERKYIEPTLPKDKIKAFRDVKSVIKYLPLKIQGECLGRVLGRKRIECHVDMVKYIDFNTVIESTTKKTLVFTSFVEALTAGAEHCKNIGLKPLAVYGKTNHELRNIVKVFAKDKQANPLLATYASLSTAVPLTMADTMIMINSPFRAYIEDQAISRIYRIGADTQTNIYRCILDTGDEPNISTRSTEILEWSQQMVEEITGVKSPFAIGASLEDFKPDDTEYDDNLMFTRFLNHHYDKLDIQLELGTEDMLINDTAPGYMNW